MATQPAPERQYLVTGLQPVVSFCPSTSLLQLRCPYFQGCTFQVMVCNQPGWSGEVSACQKQSHLGQLEAAIELWRADPAHMLSSLASQEGIAEDASSMQQPTDALLPCHTHNCTGSFLCHANVTPARQKNMSLTRIQLSKTYASTARCSERCSALSRSAWGLTIIHMLRGKALTWRQLCSLRPAGTGRPEIAAQHQGACQSGPADGHVGRHRAATQLTAFPVRPSLQRSASSGWKLMHAGRAACPVQSCKRQTICFHLFLEARQGMMIGCSSLAFGLKTRPTQQLSCMRGFGLLKDHLSGSMATSRAADSRDLETLWPWPRAAVLQ